MNKNLGGITCGGCDGGAHIRQQATGKKLLYLYCPNCGMDKRSGAKLQAKWQSAIDGTLPVQANKTEKQADEWQPEKLDREKSENDEINERTNSGTSGKIFAGIGIVSVLGLIWRAARI